MWGDVVLTVEDIQRKAKETHKGMQVDTTHKRKSISSDVVDLTINSHQKKVKLSDNNGKISSQYKFIARTKNDILRAAGIKQKSRFFKSWKT